MKNKPIIIGAIIGFIYAFIPILGVIAWGSKGGDPGPYWFFMLPPFWPVALTYFGNVAVLAYLTKFLPFLMEFGGLGKITEVTFNLLNLLVWILIGASIGYLIKKKRENEKRINLWFFIIEFILLILILSAGYFMTFGAMNISNLFIYILGVILILIMIYFVVKKMKRNKNV